MIDSNLTVLDIYTFNPAGDSDSYALEYLGHEVFHALQGEYHQKGIRIGSW